MHRRRQFAPGFGWPALTQSVWRDDRGGIAVVFAACVSALIIFAGVAIELGGAMSLKRELDSAADAAVLAGVKAAGDAFSRGEEDWQSVAQAAAISAFEANSRPGTTASKNGFTVKIERFDQSFKGTADYSAAVGTHLLSVAGFHQIEVANHFTAEYGVPNFLDVHILVDVSPSMGIGATLADQELLINGAGCALACHYSTPGAGDNFTAARATGAVLRVDVVREAVRRFIGDLKSKALDADQIRISIDAFSNQLVELFPPSTNLDAADTAAQTIDLISLPNNEGTNIAYSLAQLVAKYDSNGTGLTAESRKSYVVLLSDGIENSTYGLPSGTEGVMAEEIKDPNFVDTAPAKVNNVFETIQTIDGAACDLAKSAGHTVLTAHVEYLIPPPVNAGSVPRFNYIDNVLKEKSVNAFTECASRPALAFTAKTPEDIMAMFENISTAIVAPSMLRLTQ